MIQELKEKILNGEKITKEQALKLAEGNLEELCSAANEIREKFCGSAFDICTIINGKSGKCPENCKYCAQSAHYPVHTEEYGLLEREKLVEDALYHDRKGIMRYSVVTSGRKLTEQEIDTVCESYREIKKQCGISLCASHGLLTKEQFEKIREAGVVRYHNNLETSRRNFPNVCTTHTFDDKIKVIRAAQEAGLEVCSGGIMGMGETMEDRIDMAFTLKELGIQSVPVNVLNPISGTPFENKTPLTLDEVRRIVAVYRFILPDSVIRMAGGRGLLPDKGRSVFLSGANGAISGDMLTTSGITVDDDMAMLRELGYEVKNVNQIRTSEITGKS